MPLLESSVMAAQATNAQEWVRIWEFIQIRDFVGWVCGEGGYGLQGREGRERVRGMR